MRLEQTVLYIKLQGGGQTPASYFCREVNDGSCFFKIVDIAVLFKRQGKGLGRRIMEALLDYTYEYAPRSAYVNLIADHGTLEFYEQFGFTREELPKSAGMYLRIT